MTATFLVAIAAASLVTARMTPTYTSSASLFVSTTPTNAADAYSGGLFSQQRVASYADLATGQKLASQVIQRLGLKMTPAQLSSEISAQVAPNSVILTVSVTDPNPQNAQRLTTAVSDQLTALVADLETPPGKSTPVLKATVVNPAAAREGTAAYQSSSLVQGNENTAPIATLTERRYSGSAHRGESSTASTPSAAHDLNAAPMFVWSTTSSSTTTVRAPASASSTDGSGRRCSEASAPRCTWKPVTSSASASLTT